MDKLTEAVQRTHVRGQRPRGENNLGRAAALPFADAISAAVDELVGSNDLAGSSVGVYLEHWSKFATFAAAKGYSTAPSIESTVVRAWLAARDGAGVLPAVATQRLRRTSVRKLFHFLRAIGEASQDPTLDIDLPPRSGLANRPLDDDEVEECRWASRADYTSLRYPAVWALAEAGATMTELPRVLVSDVDLDKRFVLLRGSPRTMGRVVPPDRLGGGPAPAGSRSHCVV